MIKYQETIITEGKEIGLTKWQELWTSSTKGAISELFFPSIKERMKTMLPSQQNLWLW
jgi:hypothetical protein